MDAGPSLAPISIAYQTYGELNTDRSNAILVCHALTADQPDVKRQLIVDGRRIGRFRRKVRPRARLCRRLEARPACQRQDR